MTTITEPWAKFEAAWDESAPGYDALYGHGAHSKSEADAWRRLVQRTLPRAEYPLDVLDVGTGTGFLAEIVAALGHRVVAVDSSSQMLAVAKAKAVTKGLTIDYRASDASIPDIAPESFDVVLCRHLLWVFPDPELVLDRWRTVGRPNSKLVAIEQLRPKVSWPRQAARDAADILHPLLGTGDSHAGDFPEIPHYLQPLKRVNTAQPAVNAIRRAGYNSVQSERLEWLDAIERRSMPALERFGRRWNRYLLEAWK